MTALEGCQRRIEDAAHGHLRPGIDNDGTIVRHAGSGGVEGPLALKLSKTRRRLGPGKKERWKGTHLMTRNFET
jgi:hypothetical protein